MTQRYSHIPVEDNTELHEVHSRLDKTWGAVLDRGQTPCCYALSKNHIVLRALEKFLDLLPQGSSRHPVTAINAKENAS